MWQYKWLIAEHVSQGIRIRPLLMILFRGASVKNTPCTRNTSSRGGKLARDKLQPFEWVLKVLSKCTRFYPGMPPLQVFQQLCVSPLLKKASPWGLTAEALPWTGSTHGSWRPIQFHKKTQRFRFSHIFLCCDLDHPTNFQNPPIRAFRDNIIFPF